MSTRKALRFRSHAWTHSIRYGSAPADPHDLAGKAARAVVIKSRGSYPMALMRWLSFLRFWDTE